LIYLTEAKELLGGQVSGLSPDLETLVWNLYSDYQAEMQLGVPYDGRVQLAVERSKVKSRGQPVPQFVEAAITMAMIESATMLDMAVQRRLLSEQAISLMPGMPPTMQVVEQVTKAGWERFP
jgi:hypothetical protein